MLPRCNASCTLDVTEHCFHKMKLPWWRSIAQRLRPSHYMLFFSYSETLNILIKCVSAFFQSQHSLVSRFASGTNRILHGAAPARCSQAWAATLAQADFQVSEQFGKADFCRHIWDLGTIWYLFAGQAWKIKCACPKMKLFLHCCGSYRLSHISVRFKSIIIVIYHHDNL